jgi:hypothetical protein
MPGGEHVGKPYGVPSLGDCLSKMTIQSGVRRFMTVWRP